MADSTDIIIDYLADRAPFADDVEKVLTICADGIADPSGFTKCRRHWEKQYFPYVT